MKFTSELRELKFKVIEGQIVFRVDSNSINRFKDELTFISNNFGNDIITGSLALNLYGLIRRDITDIDILIDDKRRYQEYSKDGYDEVVSNRLGYKEFYWRKNFFSKRKYYLVDFFINNGASYIEFEFNGKLLKLHHPFEIISHKGSMVGSKHNYDLYNLFSDALS